MSDQSVDPNEENQVQPGDDSQTGDQSGQPTGQG